MKSFDAMGSDEIRSLLRWAGSRENHRDAYEAILGCPFESIFMLEKVYPTRQAPLVSLALEELSEGFLQKKFLAGPKFSYQPVHHEFEVEPEQMVSAMIVGSLHLRREGKDLIVNVAFDNPEFGSIRVSCRSEHKDLAPTFLDAVDTWIERNNFYRGQVLNPMLEFVKFPRLTWDDIILPEPVLRDVRANVVHWIEKMDDLVKLGLPARRGILVSGESGTGKTLLGRVLASTLGSTFLWVTPKYLLRSQGLHAIFEIAHELAPTVVFLEDVDFFAMDRSETRGAVLPELLNALDGLVPNDGVVTIMTTAHPDALDPALRDRPGRLDRKIVLPRPDLECRLAMLQRFLKGSMLEAGADLERVAREAEGLTGAHLREVAVQARLEALAAAGGTGAAAGAGAGAAAAAAKGPEELRISAANLEVALARVAASRQGTLGFGGREEDLAPAPAPRGFGARPRRDDETDEGSEQDRQGV